MELVPLGFYHIKLTKFNEIYVIKRPVTTVNNLMMGNIYLDQHGESLIKKRLIDNNDSEQQITVEYKKGGWVNKSQKFGVEGKIPVRDGSDKNYLIGGTWAEGVTLTNEETGEENEMWKPIPLPENSDYNQNFSRLTLQLNYLPEELKEQLPPTDVRFRPD